MSGGRRLISVRGEVARQVLLDRLAEAVEERTEERGDATFPPALEEGLGAVAGPQSTATARAVARAGYVARIVEREWFDVARAPTPWLAHEVRLLEAAPAAVAARLATAEPTERPDPDDPRAASWRVPGPGGHVRHYLARRAIRRLAVAGSADAGSLKRCWMYGFLLRCCEDAASD